MRTPNFAHVVIAEVGGHHHVGDPRRRRTLHGEGQVLGYGYGHGAQTVDLLVEGLGLQRADAGVHAGHGEEHDHVPAREARSASLRSSLTKRMLGTVLPTEAKFALQLHRAALEVGRCHGFSLVLTTMNGRTGLLFVHDRRNGPFVDGPRVLDEPEMLLVHHELAGFRDMPEQHAGDRLARMRSRKSSCSSSATVTTALPWASPNRKASGRTSLSVMMSKPSPRGRPISTRAVHRPPSLTSCAAVMRPSRMSMSNCVQALLLVQVEVGQGCARCCSMTRYSLEAMSPPPGPAERSGALLLEVQRHALGNVGSRPTMPMVGSWEHGHRLLFSPDTVWL